jgi:hypothetical protein
MTCNTPHSPAHSFADLTAILDEYSYRCDPDFDNDYEELDRQFAELRLNPERD